MFQVSSPWQVLQLHPLPISRLLQTPETCTHAIMHTHARMRMLTQCHEFACSRTCKHAHARANTHTHTQHTHTQTHTHTKKQTHTYTHIHTHTHTHTHTHIHTHTHTNVSHTHTNVTHTHKRHTHTRHTHAHTHRHTSARAPRKHTHDLKKKLVIVVFENLLGTANPYKLFLRNPKLGLGCAKPTPNNGQAANCQEKRFVRARGC